MADLDGGWLVLFSGGKESVWALDRTLENDLDVRRLLHVRPPTPDSAYHAPGAAVVPLAARSIGIPIVGAGPPTTDLEPPGLSAGGDDPPDPLEDVVGSLQDDLDGGVAGLVVGTVSDAVRAATVRSICDRLDIGFRAPLWGAEPRALATAMLEAGLEIHVVEVSAPGFDASWLGRRLDEGALAALDTLRRERGVHLLGEDGSYETIVTDGPLLARSIGVDAHREWHGTWGRLRITDAWLEQ